MPAKFTVRSIRPNNGIRQVHLSREVWMNITSEVLADLFGADVHEGDVWALAGTLVSRAGANGKRPSPLSRKL